MPALDREHTFMNASVVNREIRAVIRPLLQVHGFRAFTPRTAWRYAPGRVEVVNFQSFNAYLAEGLGCTSYSFSVNLGIYLRSVPEARGTEVKVRNGEPRPDEWQCHIRLHLERDLDQPELPRRDIWYIDEAGRYLQSAVRDARRAIADVGVPWFDRWTDVKLLDALAASSNLRLSDGTGLPGNAGSPARNYTAGYLALALGERALAAMSLARARAVRGNGREQRQDLPPFYAPHSRQPSRGRPRPHRGLTYVAAARAIRMLASLAIDVVLLLGRAIRAHGQRTVTTETPAV